MNICSGVTIEQKMKTGSPTSGFDLLRLTLAFSVILWHTTVICYGIGAETWYWTGPLRPAPFFLVPSFFALSGFLVAASLERNDIATFAFYRAVRIYPALVFEVVISAIVLGVLFTTLPLPVYFSDGDFTKYLFNVTGKIHYNLPGVFENNPSRVVNGQLWTVPLELECYALLVFLFALGLLTRIKLFAFVLFFLAFVYMMVHLLSGNFGVYDHAPQASFVIGSFVCGVIFYKMRESIGLNFVLFLFSALAAWALLMFEATELLGVIPLTYVTVYIGMLNPKIGVLKHLSNYSYGIYLYGFPIQQAIYTVFPLGRTPLINFALSCVLATLVAAVSWHFLEARIMRNRGQIKLAFVAILDRWEKGLTRGKTS